MIVRVDPSNPAPLFKQVVGSVKEAVATALLVPGDKLPSVRELARELLINPNTISRAYQVLESEGVTVSRRGSGTFIADRKLLVSAEERGRRYRAAVDKLLSDAVHLGLSEAEVRRGFEEALERFRFGPGKETR